MSEVSDSELMGSYAEGNAGAFDELFRRYEQRVYRFFRRRTSSDERAADLYQELFLRLHRFRDRFDPERPFAPWLFQIARRVLADDYRRALARPEQPLDDAVEPMQAPGAERQAADRQLAGRLLGSLPADQAGVVVAAKVEGVEYAALAGQLGRSVDAVRQTASRALRRLRALAAETG